MESEGNRAAAGGVLVNRNDPHYYHRSMQKERDKDRTGHRSPEGVQVADEQKTTKISSEKSAVAWLGIRDAASGGGRRQEELVGDDSVAGR